MNARAVRRVERVPASEVTDLRHHVLRRGTASDVADFEGDDDPLTAHLVIRDDEGTIVATSTWLERPFPSTTVETALQLRGMAVHETVQREGLGATLLEAGVQLARERRLRLVWANARDTALAFYNANGFATTGDGFVTHDTRLPHHRVIRRLR